MSERSLTREFPYPSLKFSVNSHSIGTPLASFDFDISKVTFPVFSTSIVYKISSPMLLPPVGKLALFLTLIEGS